MKKLFLIAALVIFAATDITAQTRPRISGLETDSAYIALLDTEFQLQATEDSLTGLIASVRSRFRSPDEDRQALSNEIMRLEGEIFDVRNLTGIITGQISALEQEYLIMNLYGDTPSSPEDDFPEPDSGQTSSVLVNNDIFVNNLPHEDYQNLLAAERKEREIIPYLGTLRRYVREMTEIADNYAGVQNEASADSLAERFDILKSLNTKIGDTINLLWGQIFDDKVFAYNYLLDKFNHMGRLSTLGNKSVEAGDRMAKLMQDGVGMATARYVVQKRLLLDYEKTVAEAFHLDRARDSIVLLERSFNLENLLVPEPYITRRYFPDYAELRVFAQPRYNNSNPIPETRTFPEGTIYRILLGTYNRAQNTTLFKGLFPISVTVGDDGRVSYFAGGYKTSEEMGEDIEKAKRAGFRNARPVVWRDGIYYEDISQSSSPAYLVDSDSYYRVELDPGTGDLPDAIKEIIRTVAPDKDVARLRGIFTVGPFEELLEAEKLLNAITTHSSGISAEIGRIEL